MKKVVKEKSKKTFCILAILFGFWAWLYTYKYDAAKFWIALVTNLLFFWTLIIPIGIWIWVLVDAFMTDEEILRDYYK